jgi:PBP1b-binding outer membrane lipoprotein LpoB
MIGKSPCLNPGLKACGVKNIPLAHALQNWLMAILFFNKNSTYNHRYKCIAMINHLYSVRKFKGGAALLLAIFLFASCAKDVVKPAPSTLTVKFDNTIATSTSPSAQFSTAKDAMQINGETTGNTTVEVVIYNHMAKGTFDVMGGQAAIIYTNATGVYTATSGSVTVSSFTAGRVTGTFQFSAMSSANTMVSGNDGNFDTAYNAQ